MTRARHPVTGALYWAGITLFVLWNIAVPLLAILSHHAYERCEAEEGFNLCFDFTGPILVALFAVDAIVVLVAALVHWARGRRARPTA